MEDKKENELEYYGYITAFLAQTVNHESLTLGLPPPSPLRPNLKPRPSPLVVSGE